MADKPIKGVVKAVTPAGGGWFNLSLVVEGTQYAEDYVTNVEVKAGDTISFFAKTTRQGKKMAGSPRVVQGGASTGTPPAQSEEPKGQSGTGYAFKDAGIMVSYAKDLVIAYPRPLPGDYAPGTEDAFLLDRIRYLAEGMFAIQGEVAKG